MDLGNLREKQSRHMKNEHGNEHGNEVKDSRIGSAEFLCYNIGTSYCCLSTRQDSKMADELLRELACFAKRLDQSETSWIEIRAVLEKLKSWALVKSNR